MEIVHLSLKFVNCSLFSLHKRARYSLLGDDDMGIKVIQTAVLTVLGVVILLRVAKDGKPATSEARGDSAIGE